MPDAIERTQVGKRQEIADIVTNIIAEETPFTSTIRKEGKPNQQKMDYQTETYPQVSLVGVMDNEDVTSFDSVPRKELTARQQKFRRPWKVSDFASETTVAGLPKGEKGRQKAAAAVILKFAMEGRCLSGADARIDNGQDEAYETRGVLSWLDGTAHAVDPIPADFRTPASHRHTGTLAAFTETVFREMLSASYQERRSRNSLDGYVGIDLKNHIDNWTVYTADGPASETPVRQFNQSAESKRILTVVDMLEFSAGRVRLHLSSYLALDEVTGAATAYTPRSGAFLDMRMWSMASMRRPGMYDLPNMGGGPRGYCDTIAGIKCYNPLGQLVAYISADS
jgi:hypothetical protein